MRADEPALSMQVCTVGLVRNVRVVFIPRLSLCHALHLLFKTLALAAEASHESNFRFRGMRKVSKLLRTQLPPPTEQCARTEVRGALVMMHRLLINCESYSNPYLNALIRIWANQ